MSRKQLSQTSLTTFSACASSLQPGRALTELIARRRTQSCWWFVNDMILLPKNSFAHRHSPLRLLARIYGDMLALASVRQRVYERVRTSVQAACLRFPT